MFKYKQNILLISCLKYVSVANVVRAHATCRAPSFQLISYHTKIRQNSVNCGNPKLWDSLPADILNFCSIGVLKRSLSNYFLLKYN